MPPEMILVIGLLIVIALPGLVLGLADRFGHTEVRHISRDDINHDLARDTGNPSYSGQAR